MKIKDLDHYRLELIRDFNSSEIFLCVNWKGRTYNLSNGMQFRFLDVSHIAGYKITEEILQDSDLSGLYDGYGLCMFRFDKMEDLKGFK